MTKHLWWPTLMIALALIAGCQNDENAGYRQEGDVLTRSWYDLSRSPVTPIPGDTTGTGLRRDRRTGGEIDGSDLAPYQQIQAFGKPDNIDP